MVYLTSKFHDNRVNTFGFMEGGGGGLLNHHLTVTKITGVQCSYHLAVFLLFFCSVAVFGPNLPPPPPPPPPRSHPPCTPLNKSSSVLAETNIVMTLLDQRTCIKYLLLLQTRTVGHLNWGVTVVEMVT